MNIKAEDDIVADSRGELMFSDLGNEISTASAASHHFKHGTLTGDDRESLIANAIERFLPKKQFVSSGKLFNIEGKLSLQQDVVVADHDYPILQSNSGASLIPVESAAVTIEVKSALPKNELFKSLHNCHSANSLPIAISSGFIENEVNRVSWYNPNRDRVKGQIRTSLMPKTYVYSFKGPRSAKSLRDNMAEWIVENIAKKQLAYTPPEVIVAGDVLGFCLNEAYGLEGGNLVRDDGIELHNEEVRPLYTFMKADNPFTFMAINILNSLYYRNLATNSGHVFPVDAHLPLRLYLKQNVDQAKSYMLGIYKGGIVKIDRTP